MKKIYQSTIDKGNGDCMRAVISSILDLDLLDVPNFIEFKERCHHTMMQFLIDRGYYPCYIYKHNYTTDQIIEIAKICGGINGYFYASVPSQTYEGGGHAVVVDSDLNIVHDPNPNQRCLSLTKDDVEMILVVSDFIIPDNIKMKHEILN